MIAAIYARKSTEVEKGASGLSESVDRQIEHARAFAVKRGWTVRAEFIYGDDGISGATWALLKDRERMVEAAANGKFQVLVVSEQGRLGRDMIESAYTIKMISECGVQIVSYLDGQPINVESEVDQAMLMLRGFASASERRQASQRTRDAAMRRANDGHVTGNRLYGYTNVRVDASHVRREKNPAQAAVVERIFTLYRDGHGVRSIRDLLNREGVPAPRAPKQWHSEAIRDLLGNSTYIGRIVWGRHRKMVRRGKALLAKVPTTEHLTTVAPHLRIISDELWTQVQARRASRKQAYPRSKTGQIIGRTSAADRGAAHLLSGYLKCGVCGGKVWIVSLVRGPKSAKRTQRYYACATNHYRGDAGCPNNVRVFQAGLEQSVLESLQRVLEPQAVEEAIEAMLALRRERGRDHNGRREHLERELAQVEQRERKLVEAVTRADDVEPLVRALRDEQARRQDLHAELDTLAPQVSLGGLHEESYRLSARQRVAEVMQLVFAHEDNVAPARAMLRKALDGALAVYPTEQQTKYGVRRGFRFDGPLSSDRLIEGSSLAPSRRFEPGEGMLVASGTGVTRWGCCTRPA